MEFFNAGTKKLNNQYIVFTFFPNPKNFGDSDSALQISVKMRFIIKMISLFLFILLLIAILLGITTFIATSSEEFISMPSKL
jgi:hypothetical protein